MAIATCRVPVLTGLGHEIDRSVADDVAHRALKTPTACAGALIEAVAEYRGATEATWSAIVTVAERSLTAARSSLGDRAHRVARRTHAAVERADGRLTVRRDRLRELPGRRLDAASAHLDQARTTIARRAPRHLDDQARALDGRAARLSALDPANLLRRGWSITRDTDGNVVRSVADAEPGTLITTQVADGHLTSRIEES